MKSLLVVDVQNDFCPGGSLAVKDGDRVVPFINSLRKSFPLTVFTRDCHPPGHSSFASSNPGAKVGDVIRLNGGEQVMWPDHCVRDTPGADFHPGLVVLPSDPVFFKGELKEVDSYSAFLDNDRSHETGLRAFLKEQRVTDVFVVGLATDYCVKFTVLDALGMGFTTHVYRAGCRAVNLKPGDEEGAYREMTGAGAELIE